MSTRDTDPGAAFARTRQTPAGQGAAAAAAKDTAWREYPTVDEQLSSEEPSVMPLIEKTCRALDRVAKTGGGRDAERARAALVAYGRSLDLFRQLVDLRDQAAAQASGTTSA